MGIHSVKTPLNADRREFVLLYYVHIEHYILKLMLISNIKLNTLLDFYVISRSVDHRGFRGSWPPENV